MYSLRIISDTHQPQHRKRFLHLKIVIDLILGLPPVSGVEYMKKNFRFEITCLDLECQE